MRLISSSAKPVGLAASVSGWRVNRRLAVLTAGLVWAGVVLLLATYNLEGYPTTWFDEGSHLHVPKTLVQDGVYADVSAEGFRYFGPTTGVGPTVMLPIAAAFKFAGIGLLQARLVIVAYLLVALALFYLVVRHASGTVVALFASLLLVTSPGVNLLFLGRQVLGEVPALAYLLLGILLWWRQLDAPRTGWAGLIGAGLAFGMAALTKSQVGLILVPTLALLLLLNRFYYRQIRTIRMVVLLAVVVASMAAAQLFPLLPLLGSYDLPRTLTLWRDASAGAIFVFSPSRMLSSLKFLTGPDVFAYWGLPGVCYGLYLARARTLYGFKQALLVIFVLLGLSWYAFGSIGWPRYAFPALALGATFVARLGADLVRALRQRTTPTDGTLGCTWVGSVALLILFALVVLYPLQNQARQIKSSTERSPQLAAAFINANIPLDAIVETWESELGFLTDHRYHYPPSGWLDRSVRAQWLGASVDTSGYDPFVDLEPSYLAVGRFGKYTAIYAPLLSTGTARLLTSIGEYDIYQLAPR